MRQLISGKTYKVTGPCTFDENFTWLYEPDTLTIYTIANDTGEYGYKRVGDTTAMGFKLTEELFQQWASECSMVESLYVVED